MKIRLGFVANSSSSTYLTMNLRKKGKSASVAQFFKDTFNELLEASMRHDRMTFLTAGIDEMYEEYLANVHLYKSHVVKGHDKVIVTDPEDTDLLMMYYEVMKCGAVGDWEWSMELEEETWGS